MISFRKSLGFRLFVISFILLAFPLLVDSFILVRQHFKTTISKAEEYLAENAKFREVAISELVPNSDPLIDLLVNILGLQHHFPQEGSEELNKKLKKLTEEGGLEEILLYKITKDKKYVVISASTESDIGQDHTDFINGIQLISEEGPSKTEANFIYLEALRERYFAEARLIFSSDGSTPEGVLLVYTDISESMNTLLGPDTDRYPLFFALLRADSVVYASSDPMLTFHYFRDLEPTAISLLHSEQPLSKKFFQNKPIPISYTLEYPFFEFPWRGEMQIGYIKKINNSNYFILVYASKAEIFSEPIGNFMQIYGTYSLLLFVGTLLTYFVTKRLTKPLITLSSVMEQVQQGEMEKRYRLDPFGFEINMLGETFNETTDSLIEKKKAFEEERVKRELYAKELDLGLEVQKSLFLKEKVQFPFADIATRYLPAKQVGGDFCNIFLKGKELVLMIADASGKGVEACFYSLIVRGMLRIFAKEFDDVGQAVLEANALFTQETGNTGMFVTVLLATYHPETRELSYFSAGHNPLLLRKKDGRCEMLNHLGPAMGVENRGEYVQRKVMLDPGDLVLFYTDGITEAHDEKNRLFTEKRLLRLVAEEGAEMRAAELADTILKSVEIFAGKAQQHDDITLIVMRLL